MRDFRNLESKIAAWAVAPVGGSPIVIVLGFFGSVSLSLGILSTISLLCTTILIGYFIFLFLLSGIGKRPRSQRILIWILSIIIHFLAPVLLIIYFEPFAAILAICEIFAGIFSLAGLVMALRSHETNQPTLAEQGAAANP